MSFLDVWTRWQGKAVRSLRKRGVVGTINFAGAIAKPYLLMYLIHYRLENPWYRYLGERFDRRFGVDTASTLKLPELQTDTRFRDSSPYWPTPRSIFFRMMWQLDVDYSEFVFIDFGCGKGKALLLAAELPFQQVIGIEISSKLIRVAEGNWGSFLGTRTCKTVQLTCMDAREFQLPPEPAICFFSNPFYAEVMAKVLENIRSSLAAAPREIYVLYLNPICRDLMDGSGFLTPIKQTYLYSIYRTSAVSGCADAV